MFKITEMFAFVAVDEDGDEGIMGFYSPKEGGWIPMVGADMARIESLRPMADFISKAHNKAYKILRFKLVGEIQ